MVDLDPEDGITPAVTTQPSGYVVNDCFPCSPGEGAYPVHYWTMPRIGSSDPVTVVSRSESGGLKRDAYFAPDEFGAGLTSTGGEGWALFDTFRIGFFHGTYGRGPFGISAHTQVTITGTLEAYAGYGDSAQGSVQWGTGDYDGGSYQKVLSPLVTASSDGQGVITAPFSYSATNTEDWAVSSEFWIDVGVRLHTVPPVPEPQAAALGGAGLLAVAWAVRRRRQRRDAGRGEAVRDARVGG